MLYRLGIMFVLLSAAFVGGSVLVPVALVTLGVLLMRLGRRGEDGKHTESAR